MSQSELESKLRNTALEALSPLRYQHTASVVETAARLARVYGESEEAARVAGWLHDLAREWTSEQLWQTAQKLQLPEGFDEFSVLWHGPIAANIGRNTFGITNFDILNAVTYHTSGRETMSRLEKIVFLADATEPLRAYAGIDEIRARAAIDLDEALLLSFDNMLKFLLATEQCISPRTLKARNATLLRIQSGRRT